MTLTDRYAATLEEIRDAGLFKSERVITSPQAAEITLADGRTVLNFCANNYLGLADHPAMIAAAKDALDTHGFGMASVRFICGTQDLHKQLEKTIADFFGTQDTILYAACFDANGGLFEPLLGEEDAATAGQALEPGAMAVMICIENTWAAPFATAVRRNGGEVLAFERVSAEDLLAAAETLEAADAAS